MAAVWQKTDFNVYTFDYQWTIDDAKARLQATELKTPPFNTPVRVSDRQTGEICIPSWVLSLGPMNNYQGYWIQFGVAVVGGLKNKRQNEYTGLWASVKLCALMKPTPTSTDSDDQKCGENVCHIPELEANRPTTVQLQYREPIYAKFISGSLESVLVDNSLTVYCEVTVHDFSSPKHTFVNTISVHQTPLQEPAFNLVETMEEARKNDLFTDVTLVAGKKEFKAHRVVLASQSPFFKTRFEQHWQREDNKVEMSDLTSDILEAMISFMYTGKVTVTDIDLLALQLIPAAEEYGLISLRQQCEKVLSQSLTSDNVIEKIIIAQSNKSEYLKEVCMSYIVKNSFDVRKSKGWEKLKSSAEHSSLMVEIFEAIADLIGI